MREMLKYTKLGDFFFPIIAILALIVPLFLIEQIQTINIILAIIQVLLIIFIIIMQIIQIKRRIIYERDKKLLQYHFEAERDSNSHKEFKKELKKKIENDDKLDI